MRLWTLHPQYLDPQGLVALWREALLAQAVLLGKTKGYTKHPQLVRFLSMPEPPNFICEYLKGVHAEAAKRGYSFDHAKICGNGTGGKIPVTTGQVAYEFKHFKNKLKIRNPQWLNKIKTVSTPELHPLFYPVEGNVEEWEKLAPEKTKKQSI
ncbi:MAG: DNA lyase [Nitrospirae bacterium]|nr:MAG: DNA lyase [Nitrospirota bacterium]